MGGPRAGRRGIRAVGSPYWRAPAPKPRGGSRAAVHARISVCDAFVCMQTDRSVAQAIGGGVVVSLVGAMICFTTTAASAEGPLKFAGSQLEPIKWTELAGWTADDHLAAFAAYQASCQALRKRRTDDRGQISGALSNVCRKAADLQPQDADTARAFFEQNFQPVRIARLGEAEGLLTGYFEPIVAGSRFPSPEFPVPLYRRPRDLVAAGYKPGSVAISEQGCADRSPHREQRTRPVPRPRRHRGRRARRTETRNLLAQEFVRPARDPDRRLGARDPRGRHAAARQLRFAQRLSLLARSSACSSTAISSRATKSRRSAFATGWPRIRRKLRKCAPPTAPMCSSASPGYRTTANRSARKGCR